MPLPKDKAWFYAKTHGWGWGLPARWQGWVVMVTFLVLTIVGSSRLPPHQHPLGFFAMIIGLTSALLLICWSKGEEPRWRWGDDEK